MATIFCDNDGCMFSDGCGFCDCDKLSIVDGVCEGSYGRNVSDDDELLKAENAKLRELLDGCAVLLTDRDFLHWPELCDEVLGGMRELGIEVKS